MATLEISAESTLTDRFQTTVPEPVRRALHLGKRDKIHYEVQADGSVVMRRADQHPEEDPAIVSFLQFLESDIIDAPENLQPLAKSLQKRVQSLVSGMSVDINSPMNDEG